MAVDGRRQLVRWRPGATPDGGGGGGRRQRQQRPGTDADGCGQLARSRLAVVTAEGGIAPRLRDAGGGRGEDSLPGSEAPGQGRTMRLDSCPCDAKSQCLPDPVLLTVSRRPARLCVKASSSEDAEISVSNSVAKLDTLVLLDIEFAVEIEANSSFGVLPGAVPEDPFLVGRPREMVAAGFVRMYLPGWEECEAGLHGRVSAQAVG